MNKMNLKWRWLLGLSFMCGLGVLGSDVQAQESGTSNGQVVCDTLRMTWQASANENKFFKFSGTLGGDFVLHWGDGQTTPVQATGGLDSVAHAYLQDGTYEVLLCGVPVEALAALEATMVYVEGGTFSMGATSEQGSDAYSNEKPVHSVTLDGFYIGAYEVTQAQWYAVMGTNPSYFTGDDLPVERVSWNDAVQFCEKLSQQTGKTYRLPTEAEWEYAARGGQQADGTKYAGSNTIGDVAWYYDNSGNKTHPVGTKQPNALGLYDMSGNVWEWCSDWYGSYSSSSAVNPQGPSGGYDRVVRGGGWGGNARDCRVSDRDDGMPGSWGDNYVGFRVVCEP